MIYLQFQTIWLVVTVTIVLLLDSSAVVLGQRYGWEDIGAGSNEEHNQKPKDLPAWFKLFHKDQEVHVMRGRYNVYLCVNGGDRFVMNRPEGPRKDREIDRLEKKYTRVGFKVLLHKCYYYISRKNWFPSADHYKKHRQTRQVQPEVQTAAPTKHEFIVPIPLPILAHDIDWGSGAWNELDTRAGGRHTLMSSDSSNSGAPHESG